MGLAEGEIARIDAIADGTRPGVCEFKDTCFIEHGIFQVLGLRNGEEASLTAFFRPYFVGHAFLDLAAGDSRSYMKMADFAGSCGAAGYVGVDKHRNYTDLERRNLAALAGRRYGMQTTLVNQDMLKYLARQEDGNANISMNGVDEAIVDDTAYLDELAAQMARVTSPGGFVICLGSPALRGMERRGFRRLGEREIPGSILTSQDFVFKKESQHAE